MTLASPLTAPIAARTTIGEEEGLPSASSDNANRSSSSIRSFFESKRLSKLTKLK